MLGKTLSNANEFKAEKKKEKKKTPFTDTLERRLAVVKGRGY